MGEVQVLRAPERGVGKHAPGQVGDHVVSQIQHLDLELIGILRPKCISVDRRNGPFTEINVDSFIFTDKELGRVVSVDGGVIVSIIEILLQCLGSPPSVHAEQRHRVRVGHRLDTLEVLVVLHVGAAHQVQLLQGLALGVGVGEGEEVQEPAEEADSLDRGAEAGHLVARGGGAAHHLDGDGLARHAALLDVLQHGPGEPGLAGEGHHLARGRHEALVHEQLAAAGLRAAQQVVGGVDAGAVRQRAVLAADGLGGQHRGDGGRHEEQEAEHGAGAALH